MKISTDSLSKRYSRFEALRGLTLDIEAGQLVALLGANGAGKTTLLRCLAGIAAPSYGMILYDGQVFRRDRLDLRRRLLFLPDFPVCYPHLTVAQHVGMCLRLYEVEKPGIEDRVISLLKDFDLLTIAEFPMGTLSRGQLYKAALIALLAVDPEVWLIDEPFASGMDPQGITSFKQHARDAADRGRTILYSTQILDVAERFSDRVCILHRGEIHAFDAVANLRDPKTARLGVLEGIFRELREGRA